MPSIPWWLLGLALLLFFWSVGAYNRLAGLRRDVLSAVAALIPALAARRAAALGWTGGDDRDAGQGAGASFVGGGAALELDPPSEPALRIARAAEAVRHAAGQAEAAALAAAARPLAPGRLRGVSMAEEVFERALDTWREARDAAPAGAPGAARPAGLAAAELELAMARQAFNLAVDRHNQAIDQPPARWLAAVAGFHALAALSAGPSLAVAEVSAVPAGATVGAVRAS